MPGFPVDRVDERVFPRDFSGEVVICDIDRTYLATRFSSWAGLARIPFEFAVDKRHISGMARLLRELRRGPEERSRHTPLYFVSASPAQLRPVIQRRMLLDGVEYDGTTFKDWGAIARSLRFGRLRDHVGFKLTALLLGRRALPFAARELLLGDDLESDPVAYALYADILSGRLRAERLEAVLLRHGVAPQDARAIVGLKGQVPDRDGVRRIYVRMERRRSPEAFLDFWPHVVACRGAFQMSLALWADGSIRLDGVLRVAANLGSDRPRLRDHLLDAARRGLVSREQGTAVAKGLVAEGLLDDAVVVAGLPELEAVWGTPPEGRDEGLWTPARFRRLR